MKPKYFVAVLCSALLFQADCAEVVAIVGAKSNVEKLTNEQLQQIFLGKTSFFPNGAAAEPIDQLEDSSIRSDFTEKILGKSLPQIKAYWSKAVFTGKGKPPRQLATSKDVKNLVNSNPAAIGYIEKGAVDSTVKVVFGE